MNIIKNNQGLSALVVIVIVSTTALMIGAIAASSSITSLDTEILLANHQKDSYDLWNCANETMRVWNLSDVIPTTVELFDITCDVDNQESGDDIVFSIGLDSIHLILEVDKNDKSTINNYYFE